MDEAQRLPGTQLLRAAETFGLRALESQGFRRRFVRTEHGRLHLLDAPGFGEGPPLLLVHGLGSACIDWSPLMLRLRPYVRRLIVPDLPGHGWSRITETPDRVDIHTAVTQALDALVMDQEMVAIGNSLGGFVATRWALDRPDRARALVLLSPGGAPGAELQQLLGSFALRDQEEAMAFIDRVVGEPSTPFVRWLRGWGVRRRLEGEGPRAVLQRASPDHMLRPEEVRSIRCPMLVVWGQRDDVLPDSHRRFWRENLPEHAVMEEPATYGHSPYLDDPRGLARRITRFLDDLRQSP
ncbi:MAG: alpha/beta hydrolase [Alphaproteobacteria bacterium]|nr:alpha/beta hydrolase [Alphaproteobacteria bacterium]